MSFASRLLISIATFGLGAGLALWWSAQHTTKYHWVPVTAAIIMILGVIGMAASPIRRGK